jgi:hypothetical protein
MLGMSLLQVVNINSNLLRCDFGNSLVAICLGVLVGMLLKISRKNFILKTEAIYSAECRHTGTNYTTSHFKT